MEDVTVDKAAGGGGGGRAIRDHTHGQACKTIVEIGEGSGCRR